MKKDFLDELMDELAKLHEEKKVSGLAPDIARGRTIEAFLRVAKEHQLTFEEKKTLAAMAMSADGLTAEEAETLQNLKKAEN